MKKAAIGLALAPLLFPSSIQAATRAENMFTCLSAANDRASAEQDRVAEPATEDRDSSEYRSWEQARAKADEVFLAGARGCLNDTDTRSMCALSEMMIYAGPDLSACGLEEALPNVRNYRYRNGFRWRGFGMLSFAAEVRHAELCEAGNDEGRAFMEQQKSEVMSDPRMCQALLTWYGPTGTRVPGLFRPTKN